MSSLIRDLRRRRVFRVAAVYVLVGWALVQVAVNTFPYLPLPEWMITAVIVLVALGFPPAIFLAWAFDLELTRDTRSAEARTGTTAGRVSAGLFPSAWKNGASAAAERVSRAQRAARKRKTGAPAENRVQRAVIANLRHELRNPLNAVIGYCEMALEDVLADGDAATRERLTALHGQARALIPLIDRFVPPREATDAPTATEPSHLPQIAEAAHSLSAGAQALVSATPNHGDPAFMQDMSRIAAAATRLTTVLAELRAPQIDGSEAESLRTSRVVAERVLSRLRPLEHSAIPATIPASILVVDDNALNRDLLCRQLARSGFTVASADGGAEALQRLAAGNWDLVLLDVMMPDIDGLEVLEQIQEDDRLRETPVIMISALDEIDSVVRCMEMGAADYLTKPFDPVLLRARIGAVLELRHLRDDQRRLRRHLLEAEGWNERLARGVLPLPWPDSSGAPRDGAQILSDTTVMVVDVRGTAAFADPPELLSSVRDFAASFRRLAEQYPVRTLSGARRLVAFAAPGESPDPVETLVQLALELSGTSPRACTELNPGIGIQSGMVVLGIDTSDHVLCGLWGEAIDVAERLAANAPPHGIYVSPLIHAQLSEDYTATPCGMVEIGNGRQMHSYHVGGRRPSEERPRALDAP